jgi:citrate synthase
MTDVADWWKTAIIDMEPGRIAIRGRPIESLIGTLTFPQMIWLMLRGDLPGAAQSRLLEAALVAAVDHGPQAPSIATARMAVTCGASLNQAMASAVNLLDDVHGGGGEQAVRLYMQIDAAGDLPATLDTWRAAHGPYVPGFGHRFHNPRDPRAPRLMELARNAAAQGTVSGRFAGIAEGIEIPSCNERDSLQLGRLPPRLPAQPPILTLRIGQDWWLGGEAGREADNGHSQ